MGKQGRLSRSAALVALCFCVLANSCPEQDFLEPAGQWPDEPSEAVAAAGGFVYVGAGPYLVVMNAADEPTDPHVVRRVYFPYGHVEEIALSGNHAYVAAVQAGLRIIDISTPAESVEVGYFDTPANAVAVSGGFAYVATGGGLRVIDVSTPSAPVDVYFLETGGAHEVAVSGDYAYVATGDEGLLVVDVSTPSLPVSVGLVRVHDQINGVVISGDFAYVAAQSRGLKVIDVSDPHEPYVAHAVEPPGNARDVEVSDDRAYLVDGNSGLRVFDISTPAEPAEIGFLEMGFSFQIAVAEGRAYVTSGSPWLRVVDVSIPAAPVDVGNVEFEWLWGTAVAVSGEYVGVAGTGLIGDRTGLFMLNVATPSSPLEVGFAESPGLTNDVAFSGNHAYMTVSDFGLRVVDVSSPSSPVEVGQLEISPALAVDVEGGHAYVAAGEMGLRVIDVSTPSAPYEVAVVDTTGEALDVTVSDGYAYVAAGEEGLRVIAVSTPSEPTEVGTLEMQNVRAVAVKGNYVYVLADRGLHVIDVGVPSAPAEVGFAEMSFGGVEIVVAGDCAYVAKGDPGVGVIDVRSPYTPLEVGAVDVDGSALDVAVSGGYVYVAGIGDYDPRGGLWIFEECSDLGFPTPFPSFIPAAALAAGAGEAYFETEVEINNKGDAIALVQFQWLPSGEDNSEPLSSDTFFVEPGLSMQFPNALDTLFDLEPDSVGAIGMVADSENLIGMSRTYNSPGGEEAGTFGQSLPAVPYNGMIGTGQTRRIIFMSQSPEARANLGCVNGTASEITVNVGLFDSLGTPLETIDLDLAPWSHEQINRVFGDYAPVDGYVDVTTATGSARFYCYGSMLDSQTSDPTTILPQVPSDRMVFIPAAAVAAGAEGAFFQTDVDLNNTGDFQINYSFKWLPRGQDNSSAEFSDQFSLGSGMGVRLANVLPEVFGLEPDSVGAILLVAGSEDLLAMSRTYNIPTTEAAGTFGQALPGVHQNTMMSTGEKKRIIFMRENDEFRSNLGCVNAVDAEVIVNIELFDSNGNKLGTRHMRLPPMSNKQANRIFQDYAPVSGYVDVWTDTPDASIFCYGSVLDNVTNDPTTILPQ